jgi:hypothetical protein
VPSDLRPAIFSAILHFVHQCPHSPPKSAA